MTISENVRASVDDAQMSPMEVEMLREAARNFTKGLNPIDLVRAAESGDWAAAKQSWKQLAELGWLGVLQNDELAADGLLVLTVIAEELGRAAYPMPFVEAVALILPLLARSGADIHLDLDRLITGEHFGSIAFPLSGIPSCVNELPDIEEGGTLIANRLDDAEYLLVPARSGVQPVLLIVTRPSAGWQSSAHPDLANNSYHSVDMGALGSSDQFNVTWPMLHERFDNFRLGVAAQVVGLASEAADLAVEYAKERIAFDKPIGSFQAVQQRLAESALELAGAHYVIQEAAVTHDRTMVPVACLQACEAGTKATFSAQQVWGGMGYTMEVNVQLFFRRARALQLLLGRSWELKEQIWSQIASN